MQRQPEPEYMDLAAEARAYADADFEDVNTAFVEQLIELAGDRLEACALDLGTGPGDIPARVAQARPRWRVCAADASQAMVTIARDRLNRRAICQDRVVLVCCDAKALPLASRSFDVVFSNSILHHITCVDEFWAELRRVAKPGAVVFLRDLARPGNPEAARAIVTKYSGQESALLRDEFYRSLLSAYTPEEVRAQLNRSRLFFLNVTLSTDRHLDIFGHIPR